MQSCSGLLHRGSPMCTRCIPLTEAMRRPAVGPFIQVERIVVAIDPAMSTHEVSDETGIVVAARDSQDHFYVVADLSGRYAPHEWADIGWSL